MAGDAGCGAEFDGIEEEYSVRELAVSCPCAAWLDGGYVRDAGTCTSVNGESKGKSSGRDIEDVVLSLWNVLQSLQVVRVDPQLAQRSSVPSLRQSHVAGQPRSLV